MCDPISIGILAGAAAGATGVATYAAIGAGIAGAAAGAATGALVGAGAKKALKPPSGPKLPPAQQAATLPQNQSRRSGTALGGFGGGAPPTLLTGSRGMRPDDSLLGTTSLLGR